MFDKLLKALQDVIWCWGLFELIMVIIFFPYSLVYVLFRMAQEYNSE
jgi:hypothetical protein